MNFKNFGIREWLVIAFISIGLLAFAFEDKSVKLLPKRYTREPYGIAIRKGKGTQRLKENIDFAIGDMKQKNVINRMRRKWGL